MKLDLATKLASFCPQELNQLLTDNGYTIKKGHGVAEVIDVDIREHDVKYFVRWRDPEGSFAQDEEPTSNLFVSKSPAGKVEVEY